MSIKGYFLSAALLGCCLAGAQPSYASDIFSDDFESGTLAPPSLGFSWGGATNATVITPGPDSSGNGLRFLFRGKAPGGDSFAEQRINLPGSPEYWFRYRLFVPTNYFHRTESPANNKFLAVYKADYRYPGFQVNLSTMPTSTGESKISLHYYNNGAERPPKHTDTLIISKADYGRWMDLVVRVRVPTGDGAGDGVVQVWKNGEKLVEFLSLQAYGGAEKNLIDQAYLLGWANSGFNEDTYLWVDDFTVSSSPLIGAEPEAPSSVVVD